MLNSARRFLKMPLRARIDPRMLPNYTTAAAAPNDGTDAVLFATKGASRTLTLNRPKKLNALDHNMCSLMLPRLQEYAKSDLAGTIIVKGAGGKAFCAGGDVAELALKARELGLEKAGDENIKYFQQEFGLNHLISTYKKPYVSLWDGFVMGGGVGVSAHGSFRVATERTVLSMPETSIGYYPDVGGLFFLSKLNGQIGLFAALTSYRFKGYDAYRFGLATHYLSSEVLVDLENRLSELEAGAIELNEYYRMVDSTIEEFAGEPPAGFSSDLGPKELDIIDAAFAKESVEEILETLNEHATSSPKFVAGTIKTLEQRCPLSLKVVLKAYRKFAKLDIRSAFEQELIVCHNFCHNYNFAEGVLALLVDKRPAEWKPATLPEVTSDMVDSFFKARSSSVAVNFVNDSTFNEYPHKFGLPSEQDVMDFVTGETSEQDTKVTRRDVIDHFKSKQTGGFKTGLEEYLNELLDRRTTPDEEDSSLLDWNY